MERFKSDKIKWIIVWVMLAVLTVGYLALAIPTYSHLPAVDEKGVANAIPEVVDRDVLGLQMVESDGLSLSLSSFDSVVAAADEDDSADDDTAYLEATVNLIWTSNLTDHRIQVSFSWLDTPVDSSPITDYVGYIESSYDVDGGSFAIRCYKAFYDHPIKMSVRCVSNGYVAKCNLIYEGIPSEVKVDLGSNSTVPVYPSFAGPHSFAYKIYSEFENLRFRIYCDNAISSVGELDFDFNVTVSSPSSIYVLCYPASDSSENPDGVRYELSCEDILSQVINVSIDGENRLVISPLMRFEDYFTTYRDDRTLMVKRFDGYKTNHKGLDMRPYIRITITENNYNLEENFNIYIDNYRTVSVTRDNIVF